MNTLTIPTTTLLTVAIVLDKPSNTTFGGDVQKLVLKRC